MLPAMASDVDIHWDYLRDERDPRWHTRGCLYAYTPARRSEVFYIGKAWGKTVRQRWNARDKFAEDGVRPWFSQQYRAGTHRVLIGELHISGNLTRQLVCDLESALIYAYQPAANISNIRSRGRYWRDGLIVRNVGCWPYASRVVVDSPMKVKTLRRIPR